MTDTIYTYPNETFTEHIELMLDCWEKNKNLYIHSMKRLLDKKIEDIDKLMKEMIIFHDTGKATTIYQEYIKKLQKEEDASLRYYRHELISSVLIYDYLTQQEMEEPYRSIASLTVMLHHEPIIMGQLDRLRQKKLDADAILYSLRYFKGLHPGFLGTINSLLEKNGLPKYQRISDNIIEKPEKTIIKLLNRARQYPDAQKIRIIVGGLLLPLVFCDYKAAEKREERHSVFKKLVEVNLTGNRLL